MADTIESQICTLQDESDLLLEAGDVLGALERAERAHGLATAHRDEISNGLLIDTLYLLAGVLIEADAPDEALVLYEDIAELDPNDQEIRLWRGIALLHLARFDEAHHDIEGCPRTGEGAPQVLWHLAVLAEFRGEDVEADRLFAEAHRLAPDEAPLPVRLGANEVQALLSEVIESLPEDVRVALDAVVMQIDPLPDPDLLREAEPPLSPFLLGLHVGTPWGDQSVFDQPRDVDRILIFQRNIERIAADHEGLVDQLRITLLHEIGHHLGWDEDDLAERGLE